MNKFTSLELSKKLWDNGCKIGREQCVWNNDFEKIECYPKYDILWDICVKYAKEFFGKDTITIDGFEISKENQMPLDILMMIKNEHSQEKIEKYIWENCSFRK